MYIHNFFWLLIYIVGMKDGSKFKNLANWSCAVGYGLGSGSPLSPSFNFCIELAKSSQVCESLEFSALFLYHF